MKENTQLNTQAPKSTTSSGEGFVGRVRERASEQLAQQKNRATEGMGTAADAIRRAAQELRERNSGSVADYVEQGADQLQRWSNGLRNREFGDLMRDAQTFARRRPAVFVGSAFIIGLVGARFLKSSAPATPPAWQQRGSIGRPPAGPMRSGLEPAPESM
jgi:hypothetical protein